MKRRKIRLSYPELNVSVVAEMLEDEAPTVCQIVWDMLPIEKRVLHGMYSGAEVFALLDKAVQHPPENLCQLPLPGELLYFYDGMSSVANSKKAIVASLKAPIAVKDAPWRPSSRAKRRRPVLGSSPVEKARHQLRALP